MRIIITLASLFSALQIGALSAQERNFEPYAKAGLVYDSNIFRLSGDQEALAKLGKTGTDDYSTSIGAGVTANTTLSRQQFLLAAEIFRASYADFDFLDYTGGSGEIEWGWRVGDQWSGAAKYGFSQTLPTYKEEQTVLDDLVSNRQAMFSARFRATPKWVFFANVKGTDKSYDAGQRKALDRELTGGQIGADHQTPMDSVLTVYYRFADTEFPNRVFLPASVLDNGYSDQRIGVQTSIAPGSRSVFRVHAEYLHRDHDHIVNRDFSGMLWGLAYDRSMTSKLTVGASIWREIDPVEELFANRVIEKGIALHPTWVVSSKVELTGKLAFAQQDYVDDAGPGSARDDDLVTVNVKLAFRPFRHVRCGLSWEREERESSSSPAEYAYTNIAADIQLLF